MGNIWYAGESKYLKLSKLGDWNRHYNTELALNTHG